MQYNDLDDMLLYSEDDNHIYRPKVIEDFSIPDMRGYKSHDNEHECPRCNSNITGTTSPKYNDDSGEYCLSCHLLWKWEWVGVKGNKAKEIIDDNKGV